ncbi:MAG: 7-carboxy-7-deazaguanine synthase QueE [Candidatus Methanoperedens sp.]|nr:7-carboxy-7-deazaguanine synthase QueE [Candidatus Methanoperedens sp.]MCZ7370377.1 7-carboxy-7-deazaguanine synthase QueE [Candidatus Methanoperedens sp.]
MHAQIKEIFNSIQGEGLYVGVRQVFVRFEMCQLHCAYCDTPESRTTSAACSIEGTPGKRDFHSFSNPMNRDDLEKAIRKLWSPSTRHVSLTGGEPLIHSDFIRTLNLEYPLYLETNSGFPQKARKLKDIIAIASCDIKLPEHDSTQHYSELLKNELETISIFNETAKTFVKIVVLPETTEQSLTSAVDGIASIDNNIPLILQPVTQKAEGRYDQNSMAKTSRMLLELMDFAGKKLKDVRVIPQTHTFLGML